MQLKSIARRRDTGGGQLPQLLKFIVIVQLIAAMILAGALTVSAAGVGQTVTFSGKDVPVQKIFIAIEQQTGYVVFYDQELMSGVKPVTVNASNTPLNDFLNEVLDKKLSYFIKEKTIFIEKRLPTADSRLTTGDPITGVVMDEDGNPVEGVSVQVKGTNKGAMTDANGKFSIDADPGAVLVISSVEFDNTEYKVGKSKIFKIELNRKVTSLNEVVINKGYYTTTQKLNTGNVARVDGKEIQKQPVSDPLLALEARVPGLYIAQTSGVPGSYSTVRLRGQNSIYSRTKPVTANDPLYIVDGIPFGSQTPTNQFIAFGSGIFKRDANNGDGPRQGMSPFDFLNPSDIESISVLKDADATAIYGSRGANGVILITTKKGKPGQTRFDVAINSGSSKPTRKLKLLNTNQYLQMRKEAYRNDNYVPDPSFPFFDYDVNGTWDTTRSTDWQEEMLGHPARFTNIQTNISGGNYNTKFLIGFGYNRNDAPYKGDYNNQKASMHVSLNNLSANDRLNTQLSINYNYGNSNLPAFDPMAYITLAPNAPALYDDNGNLNWEVHDGRSTFSNPYAFTVTNWVAKSHFVSGNLALNYRLLPGLNLISNVGYNRTQTNQIITNPSTYFAPPDNNPINSTIAYGASDASTWLLEPQASYNKQIGTSKIEVLAGATFQENSQRSDGANATGFSSDALLTNPAAATSQRLLGNNFTLYRYNAFFGRITYNLQDKYLLNLTARRDGSSRFGPEKRFGNFGAVGAAWIFTQAKWFASKLPVLSFGKVRASYGVTGNDQISDYQYLDTYIPDGLTYQALTGLSPTVMPNRYYAWERVTKFEAGIEMAFYKDRLQLSGSYYRNRTGNQLVGFPLPQFTGFSTVQANLPAIIENKGFEITLSSINIKTKSFSWGTNINLSIPKNRLVSYPDIEHSPFATTYVVGESLSSRLVYHYIGVDPQTGVYAFSSKSGGIVPSSPQDLSPSEPITQIYYGGILNSFSYKGFEVDAMIQFVKQNGNTILSSLGLIGGFNSNIPAFALEDVWHAPGDKAKSQMLTTGYSSLAVDAASFLTRSDGVIGDASFVRLKNLSMSYRLPPSWQKRIRARNAKLTISCQNPITKTHYKGLDPETGGLFQPPMKTLTAGFQISF